VKLFDIPRLRGGGVGQLSVTPDGQRFLIIEPQDDRCGSGARKSNTNRSRTQLDPQG